jgi:hypothetical protein
MGFYITCQYCGATEKGVHPGCGCLEERRDALVQKTIGATIITSFITKEDICGEGYTFTFLYTQYRKGFWLFSETFWVRTVLENGVDEWHLNEIIKEVQEDKVPK